jgi:hypothetical protein
MRRVTGIAAGAAVAATGLLTAGCLQGGAMGAGGAATLGTSPDSGSGTAAPSPADEQTVAAAYQKTIAAGSAHIATTTAVGLGNMTAPIDASGTIGFAANAADLTETLHGSNSATAQTRFVDGILYEELPGSMVAKLAKGKPWISVNLARLSTQGDGSLKQLMTDSPSDPSTVLGYLRGAGADVHNLGQDTIGGSPTTHYLVTIDLDQATQGQSQDTQQGIRTLEQEIGSHKLPAQVWIDQAGRVRRISVKETLTGSTASTAPTTTSQPSGALSFDFTATFSDYGVPVHITAPPPDQTTDLTTSLGGH